MADRDERSSGDTPASVRPGALSALLLELAAGPAPAGADWGAGLLAGSIVGRFELVRELGRGGFGVVWEAKDRELGRRVAFKAVRAGKHRDLREARLLREAELAAQLSHPNIVTLHDVGRSEHGPYLVMELLAGETLAEGVARGPLGVAEAVRVATEIAKALAHAHAHGVVHRDLKPANVFLCEDGRVKVLDFGLAHAFGQRKVEGGTSGYMAPEQLEGSPEDERTDVWALGAVLFELLTGRLAFSDGDASSGAPALEVPGIPALGALVARCLAARPLERPRDGSVVLSALTAIGGELERKRTRTPAPVRMRRRPRLRSRAVAAAAVAIVAVAAAGAVYWWRSGPAIRSEAGFTVAVADVVNETGEPDLDVLSGLLVTSLEQSRRLRVMTQARAIDLAIRGGRSSVTRVDETVGREVGRAHGVHALLLPAIRRLGETYVLEIRAVDPGRDEHLFSVSDRAKGREELLDLLDLLSERARRALREEPEDVEGARVHLGEAMTRSMEAYQHYLRGLDAWTREGSRAVGLRELLEAITLDPRFAAAHAELAQLYDAYGRPDLAAPHWRTALDNVDRMPEKERAILRLLRAYRAPAPDQWSRQDALRLANEIVARFPDDKWALVNAADAYRFIDEPAREGAARARALELDPGFFLAAAGAPPEKALTIARRAVANRRSSANLCVLAEALRAAGDDAEGLSVAREALGLDAGRDSLVAGLACNALYQLGAAAECIPVWERMATGGLNEHERSFAGSQVVMSLAVQGRVREALRLSRAVEEAKRGSPYDLHHLYSIGRSRFDAPAALEQVRRMPDLAWRRAYLAFYGEHEEAARISSEIQGKALDLPERIYRFTVLARKGKLAEAAVLMRSIEEALHRQRNVLGLFTASLQRAEVLFEAGRWAEAAEAWPIDPPCRCVDPPEHAANYPRLALVRARALERLGRRTEAVRELDGIVAFWKAADRDLPLLVEAKALRRRLATAATSDSPPGSSDGAAQARQVAPKP